MKRVLLHLFVLTYGSLIFAEVNLVLRASHKKSPRLEEMHKTKRKNPLTLNKSKAF
uniref:Uncharacterized protein n=1 Tax=Anguilla anguilla TaxID=7936 RepID=A0A0E9PF95_ANGAN